jgi:High-affinity nickel-transport protein
MHVLPLAFVVSLLLGMRHATDADHIVAVTTMVNRERSAWRSSRIGVMWGLGHTLTIFVVGGAIVLFKLAFTPRLGLSMEFSVALMLMVLGYLNLTRRGRIPEAVPQLRPFLVGVVHGLAGSAAATLLILPLIDDPRWALLYLGVFGLGTIVGMATVTMAIAAPAIYAGTRLERLQDGIRFASGAVSLVFGAYLGYKIGFVDGLFTAQPHWTQP